MPISVGIVGLGKIALEEHIPVLRGDAAFDLVACAGAKVALSGMATFPGIAEMLDGCPGLDAVVICTPPQAHFAAARLAFERKKHVLLEKPPCPTVGEFEELAALSKSAGVTLFQTWHARESEAVEQATRWLAQRTVRSGRVVWKEDVRQWHPGQAWIWQDGGFGVLDAAINAISILSAVIPDVIEVQSAHLLVPENCANAIAAEVTFRTGAGAVIDADFDFRDCPEQCHTIELQTDNGPLALGWPGFGVIDGGMRVQLGSQREEYAALYRRFAALIESGASDIDKRPLELVAEILRIANRSTVPPFVE